MLIESLTGSVNTSTQRKKLKIILVILIRFKNLLFQVWNYN